MAWVPVVQAVELAWLGPRKPYFIEIWPEGRLTRIAGIENGDSRRAPLVSTVSTAWVKLSIPPMPEPIMTPVRFCASSSVGIQPDISTASVAAARA